MEEKRSKILTREKVAEMLNVHVSTVDRYVKQGLLPHKKLKGRIFFDELEVRRFMFQDDALPREAKKQLDFILKKKVEQVETYRKTAQRYLGLRKILRLFDKLEKLEKQPDSVENEATKRAIEIELRSLMDEEAKAEKEEREELKKTLRGIKKEFER